MNVRSVGAVAALLFCVAPVFPALAQTIFTTEDFRQDQNLWTDPAYYRYNTIAEFEEMQVEARYGEEGTGQPDALGLASPYSYATAREHYQAWLVEAGGGTAHTAATLPDWRGRWPLAETGLEGGPNPASAFAAMLRPFYREAFVQEMKAWSEGRIWDADAFCLPGGFIAAVVNAEEFILTPDRIWILGADNTRNYIRWLYPHDSGHTAEAFAYPRWHGESIYFWDGDALIVHTNQIRGWKATPSEFTDDLETVERYRRNGDTIEGEITLYDPNVFVRPFHAKMVFELDPETRPELRPVYNSCTDTNGPSTKVYLDGQGMLNERLPGDPLYWDATDRRPWATFYALSDERYATSARQDVPDE